MTEWIKFQDCISLCLFVLPHALSRCFFLSRCEIERRVCASGTGCCSVGRIWIGCCIEQSDNNKIPFAGNSYGSQEDHKELIAAMWNRIHVCQVSCGRKLSSINLVRCFHTCLNNQHYFIIRHSQNVTTIINRIVYLLDRYIVGNIYAYAYKFIF